MLDVLYRQVDATPPVQQSLRYGNPAFRTWYSHMSEQAPGMMEQVCVYRDSGWTGVWVCVVGVISVGEQPCFEALYSHMSVNRQPA